MMRDGKPSPADRSQLWPTSDEGGERALVAESSHEDRPTPQTPRRAPATTQLSHPTTNTASDALAELIAYMSPRSVAMDDTQLRSSAEAVKASGQARAPSISFSTDTHLMNVMSHAIEDYVLAQRLPCEFYVGFQRLSLIQPQARRYTALLNSAQYVCAYGLDDAPETLFRNPRLIRFVIQPRLGTQLMWFWFVAVAYPGFETALLAQQTAGYIWSRNLSERRYNGFWTFEPAVVREVIDVLREAGRTLYFG